MGFSKVVYAYCDGNYEDCELKGQEAFGADGEFRTIAEAKSSLRLAGWQIKRETILCPTCWQALKGQTDKQAIELVKNERK